MHVLVCSSYCLLYKLLLAKANNMDRKREQLYTCAADFSLLNLPKGKSLGRSKPATNS